MKSSANEAGTAGRRLVNATRCAVVACLLGSGFSAGPAAAPDGAVLALKGAMVVVGNGQMLPGATVLVRDGRIAAVGAKVAIPVDATVVEMKGAYLYPALIDALTEQGLKRAGATGAAVGQAPAPPNHAGPDGGGFFAHVRAADQLETDGAAYASWRDAGILTFQVSPDRGIFEGQTSVVTLDGEDATPKVLRASAAMRIALRTLSVPRRAGMQVPGGLYPGSLMTVWAHIKQTLLDTQHYAKANAIPASGRPSITYPEPTRALDALRPVVEGSMAIIVPGSAAREVRRVIDLAEQFQARCVVEGGYEAARHADLLKAKKLSVLVSLNFPQKKVIVPGQVAQIVVNNAPAPPEEAYQEIQFRQHAPEGPGELAKAGVRFAFASGGLKTGAEFLANLRLAVKRGLPRDAAIRAATLSAAEILGVEQQLGSVEVGKTANLIVADRDLFEDQAQIQAIYVAGHRRAAPTAGEGTVAKASTSTPAHAAPDKADAPARRPSGTGIVDPYFGPPPQAAKEWLIRNATVMTATHGTLMNTSILVRDGKIAAIGPDLKPGAQMTIVDATGKWVTPGFIETHNHIASDAHNDATAAVTSMATIKDMINSTDIYIYYALTAGVTMVNTMHGSVNPVGGQNVVIKTRWGKEAEDLVVPGATPTLKMALGQNPKDRGTSPAAGAPRRYPASRMGVYDVIRQALTRARDYKQQWDLYEQTRTAGHPPLVPPRRDLTLEPLVEVLTGKRKIQVHSKRVDEMLMLMEMAEEFGFRIGAFHHGLECYKIATEVARHGAAVSAFDYIQIKTESWDGIPQAIPILVRHGVSVSIGTDGEGVSRMIHEAAKSRDYGLTEEEALGLITINAARQLGVDKFTGSIDEGKDADLVIFDKNPLSVYARPQQVFIDGQLYYSPERDRARQQALEADKHRLLELDDAPQSPKTTAGAGTLPRPRTPEGRLVAVVLAALVSAAPQTLAIHNARIVTVSGPVIERGTIVVRDGVIADFGSAVPVPSGAQVIEAEGLTVYPGLIDSASGIGLTEVPGIIETDDFSDLGEFMPQLLAFSAFNINSAWVAIARSMGVLHVVTSPSGGMLPGQGAIMALGGSTLHEAQIDRHGPMALDFPKLLNYESPFYQRRRHPYVDTKDYQTRMRELNEFFAGARRYMEAKDKRAAQGADSSGASDARYDAMIPVLKGQQPVYVEVQSEPDIRKAVQFAGEQRINVLLVGADDAPKMTAFLRDNAVRLVFGAPGTMPIREDDPTDSVCRAPAQLHKAGISFAFGTGRGIADDRNLRHQVGMAVACGLPHDVALRSVTLTPAEFLGVADKIGSIDRGKRGNFVLTDGDIFEYGTRIVQAVVNGTPTGVESHYTELNNKYKDRR